VEDTVHPVEVEGWPLEEYDLGQISGVDVDKSGNPVVFHRGTVMWDAGYGCNEAYFICISKFV